MGQSPVGQSGVICALASDATDATDATTRQRHKKSFILKSPLEGFEEIREWSF